MDSWDQVILAAGRSSRMGVPKARLHVRKKTQLELHIQQGQNLEVNRQVVVTGFHEARLPRGNWMEEVVVVRNPEMESGQSDSMRLGLERLSMDKPVLMQPVDQVPLQLEGLRKLLDSGDREVIVPTYQGNRGHPPLFPAWFQEEIFKLPADRGIRSLYRQFPDRIVERELKDPNVCSDLDTLEDLRNARHGESLP